MGKEADLLDHIADAAAKAHWVRLHHIAAGDEHAALVRLDHAVDDAHRRGLAATRRTDQHADFPFRNRQREMVDGRMRRAGKLLHEAADLDHRARIPTGVRIFCRYPNSLSVPIASNVAGMAPTRSCGSAIMAIPAVMKSPRPPPPM